MGRFRILVKQPHEARAKEVESLNSIVAARAVQREFFSEFKRQGFTSATKPKDNKKTWLFRGDEVATVELQFTFTTEDLRERCGGDFSVDRK
jgi:hypothetical protein